MNLRDRHIRYRDQHGGVWFDFEQIVREVYRSVIRRGDTAIDAGANFGSHTFQMAELVGRRGRILAIEAVPAVAVALERSRQGYRRLARRVQVLNRAVSDTPGLVDLYHVPSNHALSSLRDRPNVGAEKSLISVEAVRLDDLVKSAEHVSYMKLDIEGAELAALRGAAGLLHRDRPVITFEFDTVTSASFDNTAQDYIDLFSEQGYDIFDPFGYHMTSKADFEHSLVWDYVAISADGNRRDAVLSALAAYMRANFGVQI